MDLFNVSQMKCFFIFQSLHNLNLPCLICLRTDTITVKSLNLSLSSTWSCSCSWSSWIAYYVWSRQRCFHYSFVWHSTLAASQFDGALQLQHQQSMVIGALAQPSGGKRASGKRNGKDNNKTTTTTAAAAAIASKFQVTFCISLGSK